MPQSQRYYALGAPSTHAINANHSLKWWRVVPSALFEHFRFALCDLDLCVVYSRAELRQMPSVPVNWSGGHPPTKVYKIRAIARTEGDV